MVKKTSKSDKLETLLKSLFYRSEYTLNFNWKKNKSAAIDVLERNKLLENMKGMKEMEVRKTTKLEYMNIIDSNGHAMLLNRSFQDIELELNSNFSFPFNSKEFSIIPMVLLKYFSYLKYLIHVASL